MSKLATTTDTNLQPTLGKWVWKEETNTLEFVSLHPDNKDKRRKNKGHHDKNRLDRVVSSGARNLGGGKVRGPARLTNAKSPKANRRDVENDKVMLEDIKRVAHGMMSEVDIIPDSFNMLNGTDEFDHFLLNLITYFNCFFEKMAQDKRKNPMYIEPSLAERKALADACERLTVAQKLLGRSYCILVLGLGLEKQHHMSCGLSRVSSTYQDRSMFESFYNFCTFVVWITFRRRDFEIVKKEIGRMLRSDTFNPAIRVKYAQEEPKEATQPTAKKDVEEIKKENSEIKLSPAEYRRLHPKRPAIKSIVNQRSPAIVSLLPSPKEEAHWLFKRATPSRSVNEDGSDEFSLEDDLIINIQRYRMGSLSVGILNSIFRMGSLSVEQG
ncbi:protein phosphatase 1 regulatory subunit 36 [Patella vulgata]|uniref:protein phosphatase 1 regulatory subunit 36 n=1 Tax=Patella vulgata TaxID=6465 RepID=UPI0024A8A80E|nr:protein phosphatase 1 regulatory subunit 36 [Patella vulgata]